MMLDHTPGRDEYPQGRSRSPWPWFIAAFLLAVASIAMRWPGVAMYDSVSQYDQAVTGEYSDWHPPIMARTWALLNHLHSGTEPFFLLQLILWWGGLGLLAAALGRQQRHGSAAGVLLVGIAPLWLGWATVVLKDAQMACCLLAATGLVAWWRLDGRAPPRWAGAVAALFILYATLVRGNAVFATVPLALALFGWPRLPLWWHRLAAAILLVLAILAVSPFINRQLLGAEPSHVERALPLYDIAGITHYAGLPTIPGLAPSQWRDAERRGCYSPYFWNPYGEPAECDFVGEVVAMGDDPRPHLMRDWLGLVLRHPLAYAQHRLGHLNANLRFWVGPGEGDAAPPLNSERNEYGLGTPAGPAARALVALAKVMAASPLGWPYAWLALSCALLWSARKPDANSAFGRALALSAACMSASFAAISMASDLRYHLWSMIAGALALILLAPMLDWRRARIAGAPVLVILLLGIAAHLGAARKVYAPLPPRIVPAASQG